MPFVEFGERDREALAERAATEEVAEKEETLNGEELENTEDVGTVGNAEGEEPEATKEPEKSDKTEDEVAEEEVEGEKEEKTEPEALEVEYTDSEGNTFKEEIAKEDLPNIMSVAREGIKAMDYIEQIKPIMDSFGKSNVLQDIAYYVSQGHTEDEIKKGLLQLWGKEVKTEEPEFESIEEQIDFLVQKKLEEAINPLKTKLSENEDLIKKREQEIELTEIQQTNRKVLVEALQKQGHEPEGLTDVDRIAIDDTFSALYPGIDINRMQMTAKQANIIIRNALSPKGIKKAEKSKVKDMGRQSKATRSMPGNITRAQGGTEKYVPRAVPRPQSEREKRIDELFS